MLNCNVPEGKSRPHKTAHQFRRSPNSRRLPTALQPTTDDRKCNKDGDSTIASPSESVPLPPLWKGGGWGWGIWPSAPDGCLMVSRRINTVRLRETRREKTQQLLSLLPILPLPSRSLSKDPKGACYHQNRVSRSSALPYHQTRWRMAI